MAVTYRKNGWAWPKPFPKRFLWVDRGLEYGIPSYPADRSNPDALAELPPQRGASGGRRRSLIMALEWLGETIPKLNQKNPGVHRVEVSCISLDSSGNPAGQRLISVSRRASFVEALLKDCGRTHRVGRGRYRESSPSAELPEHHHVFAPPPLTTASRRQVHEQGRCSA